MPDMESLDRAVEEARVLVFRQGHYPRETCHTCEREIETLIAAVSAKARAEERASRLLVVHCRDCSWSREADSGRWAEELRMRHEQVNETHNVWITDRARSSEEAGNG